MVSKKPKPSGRSNKKATVKTRAGKTPRRDAACAHKGDKRNCETCKAAGVKGAGTRLCDAHYEYLRRCRLCKKNKVPGAGTELCDAHYVVRGQCKQCVVDGVEGAGKRLCKAHLTQLAHCGECRKDGVEGAGTSLCVRHDRVLAECGECRKDGVEGAGTRLCVRHDRLLAHCGECRKDGVEGAGTSLCVRHDRLLAHCGECRKDGVEGAGTRLCVRHDRLLAHCGECSFQASDGFKQAVLASGLGEFTAAQKEKLAAEVKRYVTDTPVVDDVTIETGIRTKSLSLYCGKGTPTNLEGDEVTWFHDEQIDWVRRTSATICAVGEDQPRRLTKAEARAIFETVCVFRSIDPRESFFVEAMMHKEMERVARESGAPRGVVCTRAVGAGNKSGAIIANAHADGTRVPISGVFVTFARVQVQSECSRLDKTLKVEVIEAKIGNAEVDVLLTQTSPAASAAATPTETPAESDDECDRKLAGLKFRFTGTVPGYKQKVCETSVTRRGASCTSSRTTKGLKGAIVVHGERPSSMVLENARKAKAKIVSAEDFIKQYILL